ncbi:MAG: FAD-binding protein [Bacteroidia bacterium]|nr:MAG: FAD-binding protein [Bacteroidia bacterium]
MRQIINLSLSPEKAADKEKYTKEITRKLKLSYQDIQEINILQRSVDARSKNIKVNLKVEVISGEEKTEEQTFRLQLNQVHTRPEVLIVGMGPAGLFAALRLIEHNFKPVILEQGNPVKERKKDLQKINRNQDLNPMSNYCFGEGGAGTFSDGKLYTRSKKRGNIRRILQIFTLYGASKNILIESHPHIGTDKLPRIIQNMREAVLQSGGEIYFNTRVEDFIIRDNICEGVIDHTGRKFKAEHTILACGHSARNIYKVLHKKGVALESKPFAMGVRVEHPQDLINEIQYHSSSPNPFLPAADYRLTSQINNRGVYSFCMCPGGFIVPASTDVKETVVNGMSPSKRNSPYANSGIVAEIKLEDYSSYHSYGNLAGLYFQENLEQLSYHNGGRGLVAPGQRLHDFVNHKLSGDLPKTSYPPGIISSPIHFWLPEFLSESLQLAFRQFGKRLYGFLTNEAVILGVESRTSSPVRIPRDAKSLMHIQIQNLYPCGEGAGYAGGIVSSAIDGERCADSIAL